MAKSTKETSATSVSGKARVRRKAVGIKSARKAGPAVSGPVAVKDEALEPVAAGADAGGSPTNDEIAKRAYEIYLHRGSRNGRDLDDWIEAERQLRGRGTR